MMPMSMMFDCTRHVIVVAAALLASMSPILAQTGSIHEPVRYVGGWVTNPHAHDGQLRPAVGVESFQVMRANRTQPEESDGFGWTYNHGPNIVYWNDRYYVQYLSNPVGEHIAPGQTLVCSSEDGRTWSDPQVVFPIYQLQPPDPPGTAMMHQRMGFYIAPGGRLLVLAFYGHAPNPFQAGGIGRVVREMYADGTCGPIYFIRYNTPSGWDESNTNYPLYTRSDDAGFVEACEALLNDRLMRMQWFDEEGLDNDAFSIRARRQPQAFNWFHRQDGTLVGLFKWSMAALSTDEGESWSNPVKCPTLQMTGAKISGRATADGRYALIYNPNMDDDHRWPLAIVTSDDGVIFDNMLCVQGEVPPRRFNGKYKDFGPQYNRCVEEGNGATPGTDLWVTYSMNKEDIWVSRIPVPVRHSVDGSVADDFDDLHAGGPVTDWNIYSPRWAPVGVVKIGDQGNQALELRDQDPYDYARAIRVFPQSRRAKIDFRLQAAQIDAGQLVIEVADRYGNRPVRFSLTDDGRAHVRNGTDQPDAAAYQTDEWLDVSVDANVAQQTFSLSMNGKSLASDAAFAEHVQSIERISFRTGPQRTEPTLKSVTAETEDVTDPNPDIRAPLAVFRIDDVRINTQ